MPKVEGPTGKASAESSTIPQSNGGDASDESLKLTEQEQVSRIKNCGRTKLDLRTDDYLAAQRCHLLELPAELRNAVYEYVLFWRDMQLLNAKDCEEPALLRTCKQFRKETSSMYGSWFIFLV